MAKFHISKSGKPAQCRAQVGKCPLGGESKHYDTREQAQQVIEQKLSTETDMLSSKSNKKNIDKNTENLVSNLTSILAKNSWNESEEISSMIDNIYENIDQYGEGSEYWDNISQQIQEKVKEEKLKTSDIKKSLETIQNNIENNENMELLKNNIDNYQDASLKEVNLEELTDNLTDAYKKMLSHDDEKIRDLAYQTRMLRDMVSTMEEAEYDDYIEVTKHKDLGDGIYYVRIEDDGEATHYLYYDKNNYLQTMEGDASSLRVQWYSDDEFSSIEKNMYMSSLNGEEKDSVLKQGMLNNLVINSDNKQNAIDRIKNMSTGENKKFVNDREINAIGVSQSILANNTFLHSQVEAGEIEFTGENNKQKADFFRSGIVKMSPKHKNYKKYETNAKQSIKESNANETNSQVKEMLKRGEYPDLQSRAPQDDNIAEKFRAIQEKDPEAFSIIREYSGDGYANYVYTAYGYDKEVYSSKHGKDMKDIEKANAVLKDFHKGVQTQKRNLYRSQRTPRGMSAKQYLDNLNIGDITMTNKITSTSVNYGETDSFGASSNKYEGSENIRFVYHSKKGVYISPISQVEEESEVLLPIGEKMVVTDKFINERGQAYVFFTDVD